MLLEGCDETVCQDCGDCPYVNPHPDQDAIEAELPPTTSTAGIGVRLLATSPYQCGATEALLVRGDSGEISLETDPVGDHTALSASPPWIVGDVEVRVENSNLDEVVVTYSQGGLPAGGAVCRFAKAGPDCDITQAPMETDGGADGGEDGGTDSGI